MQCDHFWLHTGSDVTILVWCHLPQLHTPISLGVISTELFSQSKTAVEGVIFPAGEMYAQYHVLLRLGLEGLYSMSFATDLFGRLNIPYSAAEITYELSLEPLFHTSIHY